MHLGHSTGGWVAAELSAESTAPEMNDMLGITL